MSKRVENAQAVVDRWEVECESLGWQCTQAKKRARQLRKDGNENGAVRMDDYYAAKLKLYQAAARKLEAAQWRLAVAEGRA